VEPVTEHDPPPACRTRGQGVLDLHRDGGVAVLTLTGEIDLAAVQSNGALDDLDVRPPETLDVDLSEVTFIDSSGVGMLVKLHRMTGGDMRLRSPSLPVLRVLRICGLDDVFEIESSRGSLSDDVG
jgi:anti-sigma B factor antagonist